VALRMHHCVGSPQATRMSYAAQIEGKERSFTVVVDPRRRRGTAWSMAAHAEHLGPCGLAAQLAQPDAVARQAQAALDAGAGHVWGTLGPGRRDMIASELASAR